VRVMIFSIHNYWLDSRFQSDIPRERNDSCLSGNLTGGDNERRGVHQRIEHNFYEDIQQSFNVNIIQT
jgi:hypothetical protein